MTMTSNEYYQPWKLVAPRTWEPSALEALIRTLRDTSVVGVPRRVRRKAVVVMQALTDAVLVPPTEWGAARSLSKWRGLVFRWRKDAWRWDHRQPSAQDYFASCCLQVDLDGTVTVSAQGAAGMAPYLPSFGFDVDVSDVPEAMERALWLMATAADFWRHSTDKWGCEVRAPYAFVAYPNGHARRVDIWNAP